MSYCGYENESESSGGVDKTSAWLATLPADGPTGGYFHLGQALPR
jgi:hypothetical protein